MAAGDVSIPRSSPCRAAARRALTAAHAWRVLTAARARRAERGASVIEVALLMPVLLVMLLLVVQVALIFHARQVADGAARAGARVARAAGVGDGAAGWQAEAEETARQRVRIVGSELLRDVQVQAWEENGDRGVTVTGTAVAAVPLLPGMSFTVTSRFGGPIECFRPDDGTGDCGE